MKIEEKQFLCRRRVWRHVVWWYREAIGSDSPAEILHKKAELVSTPAFIFEMNVEWSQVPLELAAVLPAFVDQEILLVINLQSYPALHDNPKS